MSALSPAIRIAAVVTAAVALGSAALSWDALQWDAGQLGVDRHLTWLYPVTIDGVIFVGTVAVLALRNANRRTRMYAWTVLVGAIGASVIGNAAHANGTDLLHRAGAAIPAAALAISLHLVVVLVRATPASPTPVRSRSAAPTPERAPAAHRRRRRAPEPKVVLPDGREVSAGHARKIRLRDRALEGAAS